MFVVIVYWASILTYMATQNRWKVKWHELYTIEIGECPTIPSKKEIRKLLRKEFHYLYVYCEFEYGKHGQFDQGNALSVLNVVSVCDNIEGVEYTMVLAHEISHCKFKSINECYVEYKAITTLYKSDNEFLHYVGVYWANEILSGQKGLFRQYHYSFGMIAIIQI